MADRVHLQMTIYVFIPQSLTPLVEGILQRDMTRFAKYATQGTAEL